MEKPVIKEQSYTIKPIFLNGEWLIDIDEDSRNTGVFIKPKDMRKVLDYISQQEQSTPLEYVYLLHTQIN